MDLTTVSMLVIVIVAICEGIKYAGVNTRFIPIISILLGILGAVWFEGINWLAAAAGIMSGLTASGLFSGFKKTILNK